MKKRVSIQLDDVDHEFLAAAARSYAISVPAYLKFAAFKLARAENTRATTPPAAAPAPQPAIPDTQPRTPMEAALFARWDAERGRQT